MTDRRQVRRTSLSAKPILQLGGPFGCGCHRAIIGNDQRRSATILVDFALLVSLGDPASLFVPQLRRTTFVQLGAKAAVDAIKTIVLIFVFGIRAIPHGDRDPS